MSGAAGSGGKNWTLGGTVAASEEERLLHSLSGIRSGSDRLTLTGILALILSISPDTSSQESLGPADSATDMLRLSSRNSDSCGLGRGGGGESSGISDAEIIIGGVFRLED
jgi:hypothetical protein